MARANRDRYDLVIVGAGSAGLTAAELAAELGLRTAIVERDRVGGDCLWTGCVPSKSLLAAAKAAHHVRTAERFGIRAGSPEVDGAAVWARIREVQDVIATTDDDPERLRARGHDVVSGPAHLHDARTVVVGDRWLRTRRVLLCTGSRPAVPDLPGLSAAGYLTSETLWAADRIPGSLVILGGGPVGTEMAQAFARLGTTVTLLQRGPRLLPKDDSDLVERLTGVLRAEGVDVRTGVTTRSVTVDGAAKVVHATAGDASFSIGAEEILIATGRRPAVDGLGLDALGIDHGPSGIRVDDRLRTSVAGISAAGDVAGRWHFTHSAGYEAALAVRNMFLPFSSAADAAIPWCTFTDPELAHVGLSWADARQRHGRRARRHVAPLDRSDRARADATTTGELRIVTVRDRIVGADLLAPGAGDLVGEMSLAVSRRVRLRQLADAVHAYPTLSTGFFRLGGDAGFRLARRVRVLARVSGR